MELTGEFVSSQILHVEFISKSGKTQTRGYMRVRPGDISWTITDSPPILDIPNKAIYLNCSKCTKAYRFTLRQLSNFVEPFRCEKCQSILWRNSMKVKDLIASKP